MTIPAKGIPAKGIPARQRSPKPVAHPVETTEEAVLPKKVTKKKLFSKE